MKCNLTTNDILMLLKEKYESNDFRISSDNTKTIELQNCSFLVDKPYICASNIYDGIYELDWYDEHYNPKIYNNEYGNQFQHMIDKITSNRATREAVLVMISQHEYETPGFICTAFMQIFLNNDNTVNYIINMRSSDVMRFPYDIKWHINNLNKICDILSKELNDKIIPGNIYWNAGSLHIYEQYFFKLWQKQF